MNKRLMTAAALGFSLALAVTGCETARHSADQAPTQSHYTVSLLSDRTMVNDINSAACELENAVWRVVDQLKYYYLRDLNGQFFELYYRVSLKKEEELSGEDWTIISVASEWDSMLDEIAAAQEVANELSRLTGPLEEHGVYSPRPLRDALRDWSRCNEVTDTQITEAWPIHSTKRALFHAYVGGFAYALDDPYNFADKAKRLATQLTALADYVDSLLLAENRDR